MDLLPDETVRVELRNRVQLLDISLFDFIKRATKGRFIWLRSTGSTLASQAIDTLGRGADVREGVLSFLEKRPPAFPHRVPDDLPPFTPWWTEPTF